jgi:diguanylate cyclase (GGDEF)-like protein
MPSMTEPTPTILESRALPSELKLFRWVASLAMLLAAFGAMFFLLIEPDHARSTALGWGITAGCSAFALAWLVLPWERMEQRWVHLPMVTGLGLLVLGTWNTGGMDSPFILFFIYVTLVAAYFSTRRQTRWIVALVCLSSATPLLYAPDGQLSEALLRWMLIAGVAAGVAIPIQRSRAHLRAAAYAAQALALQDPLTGVGNRRAFEQRVAAELARSRRHALPFAVLYVDLDGFKAVNDRLGHSAGDAVLRRVALGASTAVRGEDFVGRYGGDEFAVLLPGAGDEEARRVAARISAAVERAAPSGVASGLSASAGWAVFPRDGHTLEALMDVADDGLRDVKAAGRARGLQAARLTGVRALPGSAASLLEPEAAGAAEEPERWVPRGALYRLAGVLAAAATLWFALPFGWPTDAARGALGLLSLVAVALATGYAVPATRGRERNGWWLLAAAPLLWPLPAGALLAALACAAGIALIALAPESARDRVFQLDAAALLVVCTTATAVVIGPAIFDRLDPHGAGIVDALAPIGGLGICFATAVLTAAVVRPTVRPDVWLLGLGLLAAAIGGVVFALHFEGSFRLLREDLELLVVLGAALVATGALVRHGRERPALGAFDDRARAITAPVINAIAGGLLTTVWITTGHLPGPLVPAILVMLALRQVRIRVTDRRHRDLLAVARGTQEELAAQYRASLLALATALEARDGYTGRHGEETVALARRVAEQLGLPPEEAVEVEGAALLHDVGKIGTPNEILHKPGPLTDEEWEVMRDHPVVGERILRTVPGLERVARAVRHEHERWDGGGYPDGLAGEDIPLASRIVLVCDAYHAMTSDRPYRRARPDAEAREELVRCAGVQFDPAVVSALLAVLPPVARGTDDVAADLEPAPPAYQAAR